MNFFHRKAHLFHPINQAVGLLLGLMWLITRLPLGAQIALGKGLGRVIYLSSRKLRLTTSTNLNLCFPHLSTRERTVLCQQNFAALGLGFIETGRAWFLSDKKLASSKVEINGLEHLDAAYAKGKGVIIFSPHTFSLEILGRLLGNKYPIAVIYRPHKKAFIANILSRYRAHYGLTTIPRQNLRRVLNALNNNMAVWYAYDVDAGLKRSVFAPFFGIPTASLTVLSRIVEKTNCALIPIEFFRIGSGFDYQINLSPALKNFPTKSDYEDAVILNRYLETTIKTYPEQYLWQYKRFKTRPPGEKRFY
jgi:KDO2-lipid IV(A) lauroyltransferase